jgi:hypothetical protein
MCALLREPNLVRERLPISASRSAATVVETAGAVPLRAVAVSFWEFNDAQLSISTQM